MSVDQLMAKYQSENDGRSSNILSSIVQYHKSKGEVVTEIPIFADKILDVSALFLRTAEKGGCPEDGGSKIFWKAMCASLDIHEVHLSVLQTFYMNNLFMYERQLRLFKKKQQAQRLLASQQASLLTDQTGAPIPSPAPIPAPSTIINQGHPQGLNQPQNQAQNQGPNQGPNQGLNQSLTIPNQIQNQNNIPNQNQNQIPIQNPIARLPSRDAFDQVSQPNHPPYVQGQQGQAQFGQDHLKYMHQQQQQQQQQQQPPQQPQHQQQQPHQQHPPLPQLQQHQQLQLQQQQHHAAMAASSGIVTLPQHRVNTPNTFNPPQHNPAHPTQHPTHPTHPTQQQSQPHQTQLQQQLSQPQQQPPQQQQAPPTQQPQQQPSQQQQQQQQQQNQQQQQQVPYVKPMSQYMLKKQQKAKEAAAAAAANPMPANIARVPPPNLTPSSVSTHSSSNPSMHSSGVAAKYRPPISTQQQPTLPRPQPAFQPQYVPPPVHVPYVPPVPVGPVFVRENLPESAWPKKINEATRELDSSDPALVIKGLNTLLMKSYESDTGITLQIEIYPELLIALGSLLDALNPLGNMLFQESTGPSSLVSDSNVEVGSKRKVNSDDTYVRTLLESEVGEKQWVSSLPSDGYQLFKIFAKTLDENIFLLNVLTILKNLSFEASNEQQIGASPVLMRHFVSLLLASFGTSTPIYEASLISYDILLNISSRLDLNGAKKLSQSFWLEDCLVEARGLPLLRPRSSSLVSSKDVSTVPITRTLLSYIYASLKQSLDREQIKRGLELLMKLITAENGELFSTSPDEFLSLLVEHLCVNVSSSEPLSLSDSKYTVTAGAKSNVKVPACVSAFFTEIVDTEIRDMSLEAIWSLCTFSQSLQVRFASVPQCVRLLFRILDTRQSSSVYEKGQTGIRSDSGMQRAAQILALMSLRRKENLGKFKTIQTQMCISACSEELVQDLLCVSIAPMFIAAPAIVPSLIYDPSQPSEGGIGVPLGAY